MLGGSRGQRAQVHALLWAAEVADQCEVEGSQHLHRVCGLLLSLFAPVTIIALTPCVPVRAERAAMLLWWPLHMAPSMASAQQY